MKQVLKGDNNYVVGKAEKWQMPPSANTATGDSSGGSSLFTVATGD